MGLAFDRTATEAATAARVADLAEKRSILADAFIDDALRLSSQMWEPTVVYNFGGKDHVYEEKQVAEPPPADKRALMTAAMATAAQSLRMVPPETETQGMAAVDQWLRGMTGGTPAPE
ncbi:helix-turn-helix domain-containing protein [Streptomyces sp. NPDC002138]|uniref:helix-turn-helix domain-containing protein n=1 Tax=Streptomyces sp. NPDC002138 TaxID=3154410 RepID=UPI0033291BD9